MTKNIISLKTIPSRIKGITKTLESLSNQSAVIEDIILYIPRNYRRSRFEINDSFDLSEYCTVKLTDIDYGPASKILHAVKEFREDDVRIIYCDDDMIYHADWAKKLIDSSIENPNHCISCVGISLSDFLEAKKRKLTKGFIYKTKRALSLGMWRRKKIIHGGTIQIVKGCAGVLVKPSFFTDDVFDIPDVLWTVDDIWLSGSMRKNGIEMLCIKNGEELSSQNRENKIDELRKMKYNGVDRTNADLQCYRYFQSNYGIWLDQ